MNKRQTMLVIAACSLLLFVGRAQSPTIHSFTAVQCADYAREHNVQVRNALLNVKIQEQVNRSVTAAAYPQISASATATHFPNIGVQTFPNFIAAGTYGVLIAEGVQNGGGQPIEAPSDFGFIQAQFGTKWNANAGLSLNQILFDGQVFVGLQAREAVMDFAKKNVQLTEIQIKANIYKIYYQLAAGKIQLLQFDNNIALLETVLVNQSELFKNGFAEKLDIDKTQVQISNLKTERIKVENLMANGALGLKLLMGMPMADSLVLTETVSDDMLKEGLLQDGKYDYKDRVEFQYLELANRLNAYNVKRYKLSRYPSLLLNANYSKLAQRNEFSFFGKGPWFTSSYIGVGINLPIFSGFSTDANIKKASIELDQIKLQQEALLNSIDNEVKTAKNTYYNAVNTLDIQTKNKELAESVFNQSRKKYEAGLASSLDINIAQKDLQEAQNNYISAVYDAVIAKINYQTAIGKLP
jgi:outer membrane protein TolC